MTSVRTAQPTACRGAFGDFCIGAAGFSYAIAYFSAWDRSFVLGIGVCYTLAVGFVAAFGAYSILGSF